jgi:hypothetical protein
MSSTRARWRRLISVAATALNFLGRMAARALSFKPASNSQPSCEAAEVVYSGSATSLAQVVRPPVSARDTEAFRRGEKLGETAFNRQERRFSGVPKIARSPAHTVISLTAPGNPLPHSTHRAVATFRALEHGFGYVQWSAPQSSRLRGCGFLSPRTRH